MADSDTNQLRVLEEIRSPLWASTSPSIKWTGWSGAVRVKVRDSLSLVPISVE